MTSENNLQKLNLQFFPPVIYQDCYVIQEVRLEETSKARIYSCNKNISFVDCNIV